MLDGFPALPLFCCLMKIKLRVKEKKITLENVMSRVDCSFSVFKDKSTNRLRWVSQSSTAFKDRDNEIMSTAALQQAVEWNDARKEYGPLRYWHMDGADIGDCDFQMLHGRVLIESGTFREESWGESVQKDTRNRGISIGVKHPKGEPENGVFNNILIFERSLTPTGRESNLFTGITVKGDNDNMPEKLVKISGLVELLGEDEALKVLQGAEKTQKTAEDAGHTFKETNEDFDFSTATPEQIIAHGEALKAKSEAEEAERLEADSQESEVEVDLSEFTVEVKSIVETAIKEAFANMEVETVKTESSGISPEVQAEIDVLTTKIKELSGDQPRSAVTYRASQDPANVTTVKEAPVPELNELDAIASRMASHPYYNGVTQ